jgi:hypothetical protein
MTPSNEQQSATASPGTVPPVIPNTGIRLSGSNWSMHRMLTGDDLCYCEWREVGLFFQSRRGGILVPLSCISAFWRIHDKPPIFEVQLEDKERPEWRFVFVLAWEHCFRSKTIPNLRLAIRTANPDSSIVPPPGETSLFSRLGLQMAP